MARLITEQEPLSDKTTVDELCDRIVALSQHKYPIHEMVIRPSELVVSYYAPEGLEGLPPLPSIRDTIEGVLSSVTMVESLPGKRRRLSQAGLELVDTMLMDLSGRHAHAIGWVVGDRRRFCEFFGFDEFPETFFDLPVHVVQSVNADKLIVLGASSRLYRPRQAVVAVCSTMMEVTRDR